MKIAIFTLAAALFAAAAPAQAQQQQQQQRRPRAEARAERFDPAQRIERRVQMLDQKLNLTDDQAARIRTILTQESEQMKAQFQKHADGQRAQRSEAARDSARTVMQAHRARTHAAILQVLNADQRTEFDKIQAEMKDRGHMRGEGKRGGGKRNGASPRA